MAKKELDLKSAQLLEAVTQLDCLRKDMKAK